MSNKALILDLVEWVAECPRPYADVMKAWRTSCPRLSIWEDAIDLGLLGRAAGDGARPVVIVTPAGHELLRSEGRGVRLAASA